MFLEEAVWFHEQLQKIPAQNLYPMLDVGSGTWANRTIDQPYLDAYLFKPARDAGHKVTFLSLSPAEGVDIAGDLDDPQFLASLKDLRFKSIACCNTFAYLKDPPGVAAFLTSLVEPGGYILSASPYKYPRHRPHDRYHRPTPEQLAALYPGTTVVAWAQVTIKSSFIERCRRFHYYFPGTGSMKLRAFVKLFLPFYQTAHWQTVMSDLPWIFRRFQVSCVVLKKTITEATS